MDVKIAKIFLTNQISLKMTLSFSTKIKGKPTFFAERIIEGSKYPTSMYRNKMYMEFQKLQHDFEKRSNIGLGAIKPKFHTIRDDKKNRWKKGNKIHPVIYNRSKDRYQFLPRLSCTRVQEIEIKWFTIPLGLGASYVVEVVIDGVIYGRSPIEDVNNHKSLTELANNDGFDMAEDFFKWFKEDYTGKIIHWSNKKY